MAATTNSSSADADAQELRAALSAVDDWDSELRVLFGLDTASSSSSSGTSSVSSPHDQQKNTNVKAKSNTSRRPYRETRAARRQDIAALKAQVEELQYQVALQRAAGRKDVTRADAIRDAEAEREWKRCADAQQTLRFASELENANLRRRMEFQLRISKKISKLAKQLAQLEAAVGLPRGVSFTYYSGPRIDPCDHLKRLDRMLADATKVFSVDRFSRSSHPCLREMHFRDGTAAEVGVEYEDHAVWMLPFAVERVADALWAHTVRPAYQRRTQAYKDLYRDTESTVSRLIATPVEKDWWGPCHQQAAARRYATSDGSFLVVAKGLCHGLNGSNWHSTSNVETWLRIEEIPTPARSSPITMVKFFRRTLLQLPEDSGLSKAERHNLMHTLFSSRVQIRFQRDLDWTLQVLDDLLLTPHMAAHQISSPHGIFVQPKSVSV